MRGEQAALLEPEQASDVFRPQRQAETANIPDPIFEETAPEEVDEPFLRARKRVPVRRRGGTHLASRFAWHKRWIQVTAALAVAAGLGLAVAATLELKSVALHNANFFLASNENIQVSGNRVVTTPQVFAVFAPDLGSSLIRVPLARRQAELAQIRWVRMATVMRLWPNRLRVNIVERTPVAFARDGNTIRLVDEEGVLLELPDSAAQHYSFPVLTGISASDPLSTRAARIQIYRRFIAALDAENAHVASKLSEVDLSDPEDVRAIFIGGGRQPLVHFGDTDFLPRYRAYQSHLTEWLQQYPQLRSVDLRYGRQVVLDTGVDKNPPVTPPVIDDVTTTQATPPTGSPVKKDEVFPRAALTVKHMNHKSKIATTKRHATGKHSSTGHKRGVPQRGHTVRDPIMHVVTGTQH